MFKQISLAKREAGNNGQFLFSFFIEDDCCGVLEVKITAAEYKPWLEAFSIITAYNGLHKNTVKELAVYYYSIENNDSALLEDMAAIQRCLPEEDMMVYVPLILNKIREFDQMFANEELVEYLQTSKDLTPDQQAVLQKLHNRIKQLKLQQP